MPTYAFVDSVSATPTVLFDLDNQSPFSVVEGTQTPPPTKRYSATTSTSRDGDNIAQSSYNDRVLSIELRVELKATAEQQADGIQKLNRLLDKEQWLKWQHDSMTAPVFFRTRRGDLTVNDSMMIAKPKRTITLTIPAEPFAYGLPVTGSATINNDPTAATNPMSYVFPTIQGDVATPLSLKATTSATNTSISRCLLNVVSASSSKAMYVMQVPDSGTAAPTGWTYTSAFADTSASGGTTVRFVKASGTNVAEAFYNASAPAGDYRMLVRVSTTVGGTIYGGFYTEESQPLNATDSTYRWYDLGVIGVPTADPAGVVPTVADPSGSGSAAVRVSVSLPGSTGDVRLDAVALVPLLSLSGDVTTLLGGHTSGNAISGTTVYVDGIREQFLAVSPTTPSPAVLTLPVAGGFPSLAPGLANTLNLVRILTSFDTSGSDDKSVTTTLNYLYYPRYLYIRPATT